MVPKVVWIVISVAIMGCSTAQIKKVTEVSQKVCRQVAEYQGLVKLGTEVALSSAKTLKAKLIVHDTIDGLVVACALVGDE